MSSGSTTLHFRLLAKFCPKTVDDSCDAIEKIISTYDASVAMDMVPAGKQQEKLVQGAYTTRTSTPSSKPPSFVGPYKSQIYHCKNCDLRDTSGTNAHPNVCIAPWQSIESELFSVTHRALKNLKLVTSSSIQTSIVS